MTQEFEALARSMASNAGRSGLRIHVLPYPLEFRPADEVRKIAQEHYPRLIRALGALE